MGAPSALRANRIRRTVALAIILVMSVVYLFKLADVQMVSAAELNAEAKAKRAVPVVVPSIRGDIVDRNGVVLATTDQRYDVNLSPKNTKLNGGKFWGPDLERGAGTIEITTQQAFEEIGAITGQKASEIQKIVDDALEINPKSDFAIVKKSIDLVALNKLKALSIPWLTFVTNNSRTYPNGAVAGSLVGFTGDDLVAQAGVEMSQDACLTGVDGEETYERSADGVALPGSMVVTRKAVNGGTVELTIDRDLQWEAQQSINAQVEQVGAEWGFLVVMDARTGELVAVAENNSVDPNDVDATTPDRREARSFTYPYEPGSTFKTLTAAALIDQGVATPLSRNLTPDYLEPEPGVRFGDSFNHETKQWTLAGILTQSSNVGTAMLGTQLDAQTRYEYLQKFGLGQSTEAGMPLEDAGLFHSVKDWDPQTDYNTTFGQGLSNTIVQTAGAYQAIANGGVRIPPTLVKSCTDAHGKVTMHESGDPVKVVKPDTADQVMGLLETVVTEGWFTDLVSIPGYRIAGKTGTAEQGDGKGGYRTDYVHSFAGVFPADDPQYVAVASIAFPTSGDGGVAALTAFREAAEATIRTFHIAPSTGKFTPFATEY